MGVTVILDGVRRRMLRGDPILMSAIQVLEARTLAVRARALAPALHYRNQHTRQPVTGNAPVIVSLTTYGRRFQSVHLAVESIARGTVRPIRLILWVDDESLLANLTPGLRRLVNRGLEIIPCQNYKSHTKYYPALDLVKPDIRLVTADDDILYPRTWLERLVRSGEVHPNEVLCHRSHVVAILGDRLAPYETWLPNWTTAPSFRNFATGVSGVSYPYSVVRALMGRGTAFLEHAPLADDVWLHATAVGAGVQTRQISCIPHHFPIIPGSQDSALWRANVSEGANDRQILDTYSPGVIRTIARDF